MARKAFRLGVYHPKAENLIRESLPLRCAPIDTPRPKAERERNRAAYDTHDLEIPIQTRFYDW